jgi:hypothetical protein
MRRAGYLLILLMLVAFPYGPLFPWSPVQPGYVAEHFEHADILHAAGLDLDPAYRNIEQYMNDAANFHALRFRKRLTVVACRDWSDFERFMPQYRKRNLGALTLATGTVIYVTPKLREKGFDTGEFLRHELSHAVLNQHQSLINAYRITGQEWFYEGSAVLVGKQRAYVSAAEFTESARHQELWQAFDGSPQHDMRFAYQSWRYFWDYEISTVGRNSYLQLQLKCMATPEACRSSFAEVYGTPLQQAVAKFQADIRTNRYQPAN